MKLTDKSCKAALSKDKPYKLSDGGGLYLLVHPNGSKYWRWKYRYFGKEKLMSIGVYPEVSLKEARDARQAAKKLLSEKRDPMAEKGIFELTAKLNSSNTFEAVGKEWVSKNAETWSPGYLKKINKILDKNVYPKIGKRPISKITAPELLELLRIIEEREALDIALKTRQVCGMIFRYGIQTAKCERDPSADLKGAVKTRRTIHYRTLELESLPEFLMALERNEARLFERTRRAVWHSILTFGRPGEVRQAEWAEIDFKNCEWKILGQKMKMKRDHIVPLSTQAVENLRNQHKETGHLKYVFPSQIIPSKPMSDGTVNNAIKQLGYGGDLVAHGFRAFARTHIREQLGYDSEIIEKQLAHLTSNPLGEAYDRTQFLTERKRMMQDWSDYIFSKLK